MTGSTERGIRWLAVAAALGLASLSACSALLGANDPIEVNGEDGSVSPDGPSSEGEAEAEASAAGNDASGGMPDADAGSDDRTTMPDGPANEAGFSGDGGPRPEAGFAWPPPSPPGELAFSGTGISVWGVTSDGWIVASDGSSTFALPLSSFSAQAPVRITNAPPYGVVVTNTTAFVWTNVQPTPPIGTLTVWHQGSTPNPVSNASVPFFAFEYSGQVVYADSASGTTGHLTVNYSPSSGFSNVYLGSPVDPSSPRFDGENGALFFNTCPDATMTACQIVRVDSNGNASVVAGATGLAPAWAVDVAGDTLLVAPAGGGGKVIDPASGTTNATFDQDAGVLTGAALSSNGSDAFYAIGGALKRITVATAAESTLASPANNVWMLSQDGQHVIYATVPRDSFGCADIAVVSTSPGDTPRTLGQAPAFPLGFVDPATFAGVSSIQEQSSGTGQVWTVPWSQGPAGALSTLATQSALQMIAPQSAAGALVYDDAVTGNHADLHLFTEAFSAPPLIASQASLLFAIAPQPSVLAYATDNGFQGAGIYVAQLPH